MNKITLDKTVAISIKYNKEQPAPTITAKGYGYMAEEILRIAREHNIPIKQDEQLTQLLAQVEIDEEIPEALYEAVAQVLIFAYQFIEENEK